MSVIYRKLTETGDYTFGHNMLDFYEDIDAVAQAIQTRLQLYLGAFWRDLTDGLPLFQEIIASSGSQDHLLQVDNIFQERIKGTPGVLGIVSYTSSFNRETREYSFEATVQTEYSITIITGTV